MSLSKLSIYWYRWTASKARKLPTTQLEYDYFKSVLKEAYQVPDEPQVWALVAGHITSTPPHELKKPWGYIANAAKRLEINKLAQENKARAIKELQDKLEVLTRAESERVKKELGESKEIEISPDISKGIELIEDLK